MSYSTSAHIVFDQMLATLDGLLVKAAESERASALFEGRLAEDMFPRLHRYASRSSRS